MFSIPPDRFEPQVVVTTGLHIVRWGTYLKLENRPIPYRSGGFLVEYIIKVIIIIKQKVIKKWAEDGKIKNELIGN